MANNVYIGMRYVPIYMGAWDSSLSYEALCIVDYGNNTYTSKKPVPVGTLPTNTDYWALTGNYNGAIISLQGRMDSAENNIDNLQSDVAGLDTEIGTKDTAMKSRKVIFIGDSFDRFNAGHSWAERVAALLGVAGFYNACRDRAGFATNPTIPGVVPFMSYFPDLVIPDEETYTDIVIACGANDTPVSGSVDAGTLNVAIEIFINYLRTRFTGVERIYLGQLSFKHDTSQKYFNQHDVTVTYQNAAKQFGLIYLNGVENILKYVPYIGPDNIHPTPAGADALGNGIAEAILSGYCDVEFRQRVQLETYAQGSGTIYTSDEAPYVVVDFRNGIYTLRFEFCAFSCNSEIGLTAHTPFLKFDRNAVSLPLFIQIPMVLFDRRAYLTGTTPNVLSATFHTFLVECDAADQTIKIMAQNSSSNDAMFNTYGVNATVMPQG